MSKNDPLREYHRKRNFARTPEPNKDRKERRTHAKPIFVIQEHDASHLHYDFRLEVDGTLKSWAVPKGISDDPRVKRLAIATEDHPLGYANFGGIIPAGEYGAGSVLLWDKGSYQNLTHDNRGNQVPTRRALMNGHVTVGLNGRRLKGGYALTRLKASNQWLLVKVRDTEAGVKRNPKPSHSRPARSGRARSRVRRQETKKAHA